MAKFYGEVGFGITVDTRPGVSEVVIQEFPYYGDVLTNSRSLSQGENLNDDLSLNNSLSIVADPFANQHYFAIRYVRWMGSLWSVTTVEVKAPRLILRVGGVYHGRSLATPGPPGGNSGG